MKRVLIFGMTDNPGGMENCIMNYYRNIDKNKIHFDFLTNFQQIAYQQELEAGNSKIFVIPKKGDNLLNYKRELINFFKDNAKDYDVIWYNTCSLANIDYLKMAKKYGIKKRIIHAHNSGNEASQIKYLFHKINRRLISKYATDFWSCSMNAARYFFNDNIISSSKHNLVYNAINLKDFSFDNTMRNKIRKELQIDDCFVIGNVGRFQIQKNHLFLIDIFWQVLKKRSDAVLLLIGQGELESQVQERVQKYGLEKKVIFLGVRDDVNKILSALDVFVFPSLFEGLGLALIEAQAVGLPCITSNVVVPNEVNITGLVKFVNLDHNPEEWASAICQVDLTKERDTFDSMIISNGYDIRAESKKLEKMF